MQGGWREIIHRPPATARLTSLTPSIRPNNRAKTLQRGSMATPIDACRPPRHARQLSAWPGWTRQPIRKATMAQEGSGATGVVVGLSDITRCRSPGSVDRWVAAVESEIPGTRAPSDFRAYPATKVWHWTERAATMTITDTPRGGTHWAKLRHRALRGARNEGGLP